MARVTKIVVHNSDSSFGSSILINNWHKERGWMNPEGISCGYTAVISNGRPTSKSDYIEILDGSIEWGRGLNFDLELDANEIGAHVSGMNSTSLGICLIGKEEKDFTDKQKVSLTKLLLFLLNKFMLTPDDVLGHYETPSGKEQGKNCPLLPMGKYREFLWHEYRKL